MSEKLPKIAFVLLVIFIILQTFGFMFYSLAYNPAAAEEAKLKMPDPKITIPGMKKLAAPVCDANGVCHINWIGEYIAGVYRYAIGFVGILATVVMMVGGIMWIVAGGNATRIGEARSWIVAALTGLILSLTSYMILYQLNPDLVKLASLPIAKVKPYVPTTQTTQTTAGQVCCITTNSSYVRTCEETDENTCTERRARSPQVITVQPFPAPCSQHTQCSAQLNCANKSNGIQCGENMMCVGGRCQPCRSSVYEICSGDVKCCAYKNLTCEEGGCAEKPRIDCSIPAYDGINCRTGGVCYNGECKNCVNNEGSTCSYTPCCEGLTCCDISWGFDRCRRECPN